MPPETAAHCRFNVRPREIKPGVSASLAKSILHAATGDRDGVVLAFDDRQGRQGSPEVGDPGILLRLQPASTERLHSLRGSKTLANQRLVVAVNKSRKEGNAASPIVAGFEMSKSLDSTQPQAQEDLRRGLKSRHVQMIAIGGTIGVGLFLGSASAIQKAGPGLTLSYAFGAVAIYFIMRALGELLLYRPVSGSFSTYAEEFIGPWAGFATGWSYWFMWVATGMAEISAVGVYVHYWFPAVPQWVPAFITLALLFSANLLAVKLFGEVEFWFALLKVATIVVTIGLGLTIIILKWGELGKTAGFSNLWTHGGFLPFGALGVLLSMQMVMFAYQGVELVGVSAGETENPEQALPEAINGVLYWMAALYVGSLLIIMSLVAWNRLSPDASPFVLVFEKVGIPAGAQIINLVVITAAASACNSGIFSTGRMLHSLAKANHAPRIFGKLNGRNIPAIGVAASTGAMLVGVALNYVVPKQVFVYVTSVSLVGSVWTWAMIVIAHLGYRKAIARNEKPPVAYRMPGSPYTNGFAIAFLVGVAMLLSLDQDTRIALYVAPVWFAILGAGYQIAKPRAQRRA